MVWIVTWLLMLLAAPALHAQGDSVRFFEEKIRPVPRDPLPELSQR